MTDSSYYIELVLLSAFTLVLAGLILYIFSKPLKTLLYILKCEKAAAVALTGEYEDKDGTPVKCVPTALYRDENGVRIITLRKADFVSYLRFYPTSEMKINVYIDKNGNFTMLSYFIRTLARAVLLAAIPVLLLIGTAAMLYYETADYHIIERVFIHT